MTGRQGAKLGTSAEKNLIVSDDEASCLGLRQLSKNAAKVTRRTRPDDLYLCAHFLSGGESIVGLRIPV